MQISELHMLVMLAEEMNMRKAAERLFVSQPALSQRLQSIEKSWGFKIFIRSQRGLTITPQGEKVIQFAREMVAKEEKIREEITQMDGEIYGTLKMAVASIIGQHWLPKVLKDYVELYPQAKISLVTGWSSEMLKSMYEEDIHIGIIRGNPEWKGIKKHLLTDTLYLVDKEIRCLEDLLYTERPFIQFKSDSTYYQEIQYWWHQQIQFTPKRTIVVDQIETCKQMAFNGIGFAILPSVTLQNAGDHLFKIPLLDEKGKAIKRDTWLLGTEASLQLKHVQRFIEIAKKHSESHNEIE
ncbi:LysR family transcriptional regulator [Bacillus sp. FJAT-47783]|uniref:LysR family transcriptional regulator n=1 Tax=Bacillus sp. FJAT-47783 TaxID=2922712 RepID=UPI001FAE20E1|nr:LysR family transcriptional regulator [Bacillus sp. FJAT-47783]